MSLKGFALMVVMVSKQAVNTTVGFERVAIVMMFEVAGFAVTQLRLEVRMHRMESPECGE